MKNVIIVILLVLSFLNIYSKDYELLKSENYSIYSGGKFLSAIKIDSVVKNDDEVRYYIHPNVTVDPVTNCYSLSTSSWLGAEVVLKDGYWKFITLTDRFVQIKDDPKLNEEWIFAEEEGKYKMTAKVIGYETAVINNVVDSIKVISLNVIFFSGNFYENRYKDLTIKISKTYGLYSFFEFYNFPYNQSFDKCTVIAINDEKYLPYSKFDVYNFNIGDEFHISEYSKSGTFKLWDANIILKVIEKKIIELPILKIEYKFKKIAKIVKLYKPDKIDTTIFINGEVTEKYTISSRDTLFFGGELIKEDSWSENRYYDVPFYIFDKYFNKMALLYDLPLEKENDSCFFEAISEGINYFLHFNGLGGPYYNDFWDPNNFSYRGLKYYKKGDEEFGTPFNPQDLTVSVKDSETIKNVAIYLPMTEEVLIKTNNFHDNSRIEIFDNNGKIVYHSNVDLIDNVFKLNVNNFANGIYLFSISDFKGNTFEKGKFSILR